MVHQQQTPPVQQHRPTLELLHCKPRVLGSFTSKQKPGSFTQNTVDGSEIRLRNQLRLVVYPIIYTVLNIPGGAGFFSINSSGELDLGDLQIDTVTTKYMKIWILSNSITVVVWKLV